MKQSYLCAGIMTGNSLDGVDIVLTKFEDGQITDICGYSQATPQFIGDGFRALKAVLAKNNGDIASICRQNNEQFLQLHNAYIEWIAQAVKDMLQKNNISPLKVDAIGFHGQTCHHFPPSIAGEAKASTLQIGSGQMLADLVNIPVVFDFRSDDILNGGEGAPLAPLHNQHLWQALHNQGISSAAFCNGGNTGNIAIVYPDGVCGWDCGPFNHFVDSLVQTQIGEQCDFDGHLGQQGNINYEWINDLFEHSVITAQGDNFLLLPAPKSSDPAWYKMPPANNISFYDQIRSLEFFSAYIMVYSLQFSPIKTPDCFLIFGGGWNNPIIRADFEDLLHGKAQVLPCHQQLFARLANPKASIKWSDVYGYSSQYTEARIFADMAMYRLQNIPYTTRQTTGCQTPTICGELVYPHGHNNQLWSRAATESQPIDQAQPSEPVTSNKSSAQRKKLGFRRSKRR